MPTPIVASGTNWSPAPTATIHRAQGDPIILLVPVDGLLAADTLLADFACQGVVPIGKERNAGIDVITGAQAQATYLDEPLLDGIDSGASVLVIDLDAADTEAAGIGKWRFTVRAGGAEQNVVLAGFLTLSRRIPSAA